MSTTFIDTNAISPQAQPGGKGSYAEILNKSLCGAENVVASLRWLKSGESITPSCDDKTHQVIYVMEGQGVISLDGKEYAVGAGAGVYLGPNESAKIGQSGDSAIKLFHLVVPKAEN